jgi:hypothetical protein
MRLANSNASPSINWLARLGDRRGVNAAFTMLD